MATGAATRGVSSAGAKPATGMPLIGDTADLLAQLHQTQALLKTTQDCGRIDARICFAAVMGPELGNIATSPGVIAAPADELVKNDTDLDTTLLTKHDSSGKDIPMKAYKKKVREAVSARLTKDRADAHTQAQAQWQAVGIETAKAAAHEIYNLKVTTHLPNRRRVL